MQPKCMDQPVNVQNNNDMMDQPQRLNQIPIQPKHRRQEWKYQEIHLNSFCLLLFLCSKSSCFLVFQLYVKRESKLCITVHVFFLIVYHSCCLLHIILCSIEFFFFLDQNSTCLFLSLSVIIIWPAYSH